MEAARQQHHQRQADVAAKAAAEAAQAAAEAAQAAATQAKAVETEPSVETDPATNNSPSKTRAEALKRKREELLRQMAELEALESEDPAPDALESDDSETNSPAPVGLETKPIQSEDTASSHTLPLKPEPLDATDAQPQASEPSPDKLGAEEPIETTQDSVRPTAPSSSEPTSQSVPKQAAVPEPAAVSKQVVAEQTVSEPDEQVAPKLAESMTMPSELEAPKREPTGDSVAAPMHTDTKAETKQASDPPTLTTSSVTPSVVAAHQSRGMEQGGANRETTLREALVEQTTESTEAEASLKALVHEAESLEEELPTALSQEATGHSAQDPAPTLAEARPTDDAANQDELSVQNTENAKLGPGETAPTLAPTPDDAAPVPRASDTEPQGMAEQSSSDQSTEADVSLLEAPEISMQEIPPVERVDSPPELPEPTFNSRRVETEATVVRNIARRAPGEGREDSSLNLESQHAEAVSPEATRQEPSVSTKDNVVKSVESEDQRNSREAQLPEPASEMPELPSEQIEQETEPDHNADPNHDKDTADIAAAEETEDWEEVERAEEPEEPVAPEDSRDSEELASEVAEPEPKSVQEIVEEQLDQERENLLASLQDKYPHDCQKWARRSGCRRNARWMKNNCARSCVAQEFDDGLQARRAELYELVEAEMFREEEEDVNTAHAEEPLQPDHAPDHGGADHASAHATMAPASETEAHQLEAAQDPHRVPTANPMGQEPSQPEQALKSESEPQLDLDPNSELQQAHHSSEPVPEPEPESDPEPELQQAHHNSEPETKQEPVPEPVEAAASLLEPAPDTHHESEPEPETAQKEEPHDVTKSSADRQNEPKQQIHEHIHEHTTLPPATASSSDVIHDAENGDTARNQEEDSGANPELRASPFTRQRAPPMPRAPSRCKDPLSIARLFGSSTLAGVDLDELARTVAAATPWADDDCPTTLAVAVSAFAAATVWMFTASWCCCCGSSGGSTSKMAAITKAHTELKSERDRLADQARLAREAQDQVEGQLSQVKAQNKSLKGEIQELQQEAKRLQATVDKQARALQSAPGPEAPTLVRKLQRHASDSQLATEELQKRVDVLQKEKEEALTAVNAWQQSYAQYEEYAKSLQAHAEALQQQLQQQQQQQAQSAEADAGAADSAPTSAAVDELRRTLSARDQEVTDLRSMLATAAPDAEETSQKLEKSTARVAALTERCDSLKVQLEQKDMALTALRDRVERLQAAVDAGSGGSAGTQVKMLTHQLEEAERRQLDLVQGREEKIRTIKELYEERARKAEEQLLEARQRIKAMEADMLRVPSPTADSSAMRQIEELQRQLQEACAARDKTEVQLHRAREKLVAQADQNAHLIQLSMLSGHKPKNHLSINRRKATQVRREAPPEAAPTPSTAAEKKKYDHVESKVAAFTKVHTPGCRCFSMEVSALICLVLPDYLWY
ncbi:uncharacterized protein MONBRDRAFT_38101 [Monosiga brevicollis MX1]|uniref:ShKT domain-containing protein n=1 Tax=Monosiga brevicollis TaxID=81824 RepID=A9V5P0_MONBE|nr:uncharacterized protein MONBRDRAFT_38101 [Monosiga brevicollis MX1]EDQ87074.1 predicted protein [Monosiga brevicollis MX1]|eukprot:XP_001748017.1 hypothetical protein [Monosiga brevicollis MX1]